MKLRNLIGMAVLTGMVMGCTEREVVMQEVCIGIGNVRSGSLETEYALSHRVENGAVKVEAGKWYQFKPGDVTFQGGGIGVELPDWGEGE